MKCIEVLSFLLILFLINAVKSYKICDYSNVECTTKGAQNVLKTILSRSRGTTEPIDPLHLTNLEGKYLSVKYIISNATLTGLGNCQVTRLKLTAEDSTFEYDLQCPQLILRHYYVAKGTWGPVEIDSNGFATITYNDYKIKFRGKFGEYISEKDHKRYYYEISYDTVFEPKGTVTVDISPLHRDQKKAELAQTFLNENLKEAEIFLRFPLMETYMAMLMKTIDSYIRNVPGEELIPADYE